MRNIPILGAPEESSRPHGAERPSFFVTLSQIIALVVGLTAFVYVAGGAVLWIRLFRSDLPADSVVTSLPRELVIGVGLKSVVAPAAVLAILAATALAMVTTAARLGRGQKRTHGVIAVVLGLAIFGAGFLISIRVGSTFAFPVVNLPIEPVVASAVFYLALAIGLGGKYVQQGFWDPMKIALAAAVIGLIGAGLRIGLEFADPRLDNAVVCVNDGGISYDGLLIGQAQEAVYLGQRFHEDDGVVVSIPQSRVDELWIGSDKRACSDRDQSRDRPVARD